MLRVSDESIIGSALLRTVHFLLQNFIVLLEFVVLLLKLQVVVFEGSVEADKFADLFDRFLVLNIGNTAAAAAFV